MLDCLNDNEFQREIIRSTQTREYYYQFFPSSRKQKQRKGKRKRRELFFTCAERERES